MNYLNLFLYGLVVIVVLWRLKRIIGLLRYIFVYLKAFVQTKELNKKSE